MAARSLITASGSGFSAEPTRTEARRQLRLSLGVVVALASCIVSAAVSIGPHPLVVRRHVVSSLPIVTMHAEAHVVGAEAI